MNMNLSAKTLALGVLLLSFFQVNVYAQVNDSFKHVAKKDERLVNIASQYGLSQTELVNANPDALGKVYIKAGEELTIPKKMKVRKYTVKQGESLTAIAQREGLSLNQLAQANNLSNTSQLQKGQSLNIPQVAQVKSDDTSGKQYRVQYLDNLTIIANNHKVPVKLLAEVNNMRLNDELQFGKLLTIPTQQQVNDYSNKNNATTNTKVDGSQSAGNTIKNSNNSQEYTVKRGDTLLGVAQKFKVNFIDLAAFNGLNYYDYLSIGQKLDIPPSNQSKNTNQN